MRPKATIKTLAGKGKTLVVEFELKPKNEYDNFLTPIPRKLISTTTVCDSRIIA